MVYFSQLHLAPAASVVLCVGPLVVRSIHQSKAVCSALKRRLSCVSYVRAVHHQQIITPVLDVMQLQLQQAGCVRG